MHSRIDMKLWRCGRLKRDVGDMALSVVTFDYEEVFPGRALQHRKMGMRSESPVPVGMDRAPAPAAACGLTEEWKVYGLARDVP